MKYRVTLTATASVTTSVEVTAEDEKAARVQALQTADDGDVVWEYDGVIDGTVEALDAEVSQ